MTNLRQPLTFTKLHSDFAVTSRYGYECPVISQQVLEHILAKGRQVTQQELHDYFSYSGCAIEGSADVNGQPLTFSFDAAVLCSFRYIKKQQAFTPAVLLSGYAKSLVQAELAHFPLQAFGEYCYCKHIDVRHCNSGSAEYLLRSKNNF
ncbi:hypothetical protein ACKC9G_13200 [Pokkaliibacter sp. CJK22405]|uniref:hypothetical protein n=1 Tax=Pokkaliibacter sp. CJK22405 TaxID=3384615 RepID=UPI003984C898